MPTRTPIPVSRAMRQISADLDLARRQQRIPVALLAERAGLSMPTVTKMLRTGNGSFENFLPHCSSARTAGRRTASDGPS